MNEKCRAFHGLTIHDRILVSTSVRRLSNVKAVLEDRWHSTGDLVLVGGHQ